MTDELCAREGCGAPKAWHDDEVSLTELREVDSWRPNAKHTGISRMPWNLVSGSCIGAWCDCTAYLPPEPPKPERKAYVVEATGAEIHYWSGDDVHSIGGIPAIPLAEYLAAHPEARWPAYDDLPGAERAAFERVAAKLSEPEPLCICGGEADDHDPVTGRCSHVAKRAIPYAVGEARSIRIETLACQCQKFEAQP